MEFPVIHQGKTVGNCVLTEQGLYWQLECSCCLVSDRVERLYSGTKRLGVLEREGNRLTCNRRLSRASTPELPPAAGVLTLEPIQNRDPWNGEILGFRLSGFREGDVLLFPYDETKPCPCEPLICFFEIADGFWKLKPDPEWIS